MTPRLILLGIFFSILCGLTLSAEAQTGQCMTMGVFTNCTDSQGHTSTFQDLGGGLGAYSDSTGRAGQTFSMPSPNGAMGSFSDSTGRQGTFQQMGPLGTWSDNRGNSGQWMDLGGGMSSYQTQPNRRNGR